MKPARLHADPALWEEAEEAQVTVHPKDQQDVSTRTDASSSSEENTSDEEDVE